MSEIERITVVGATGKLAVPVVEELTKHFKVRAIVRNPEKAAKLLPREVEIVEGDLRNQASLEQGLVGQDAVYINLSTETTDPSLDFYEEREGVDNLVRAARKCNIKHISKIGALGAYPLATHLKGANILPNIIRMQGHRIIEESGIPYTIFDPTFFMDMLLWINNGKALQWIGNTGKQQLRWVSSGDYAKAVVKAIQSPQHWNKHYPIQGQQAMNPATAMRRFISAYEPTLKIRAFPVWMVKLIGIFNPEMRFLAHMFAYFEKQEDPFYADATWRELGKPTMTIEEFARRHRDGTQLKTSP